MRKLLIAAAFGAFLPTFASAQPEILNPEQAVIKSSATIVLVSISSSAMTRVDTPQLSGSFVAEIQNNETTDDACCAFDVAATTSTASATGKSCRVIYKNGGTWVVQRWYQNLALYCQTLSTSAAKKVVITQGK